MPLDPIAYKPYADPDDFIREVTDLIWVDRAIGYIRENYEPDSIVHGAYGTSATRDEVIEGRLMRISDTPDRIGQAEDVIWEARGDDAFLSSHLVLSGRPQQRLRQPDHRQLPLPSRPDGRGVGGPRLARHRAADSGDDPDELARRKAFRGYTGSVDRAGAGRRDRRGRQRSAAGRLPRRGRDWCWSSSSGSGTTATWRRSRTSCVRDLVLHTVGNRTVIRPEGYRRCAAAACCGPSRAGSSRSATSRPTTPSATPDCGSP